MRYFGVTTMKQELTPGKKLLIEERRKAVADKRKSGMTMREIADELLLDDRFNDVGVSLGTVHSDLDVILARFRKDQLQAHSDMIILEVARLDAILRAIWPQAMEGKLKAVDRVLRIAERRAKLLGLDASLCLPLDLDVRLLSLEQLEAIVGGKRRLQLVG